MSTFIIFSVFAIINFIAFILMALDKFYAVKGKWRISEAALVTVSFFGGSLGTLLGMIVCKHKINKVKFRYGVPVIVFLQLGGCMWLAYKNILNLSIQLIR